MNDIIRKMFEDITKKGEVGYYIVHSIPRLNTVITDGKYIIHSVQSGYENLLLTEINKDNIFVFEGYTYEATLSGLKLLDIFIYGDNKNFYRSGDLNNLIFNPAYWSCIIISYNLYICF